MKIANPFWLAMTLLASLYITNTIAGTVTMDGSLPGSVSPSGSTYTISLGRQSAGNQFYSFNQLNLVKGDIASFTVPKGVSSVISRVTGGQSSIDGTISAPGASFYLINNQGVIFGPDASLNVGGAFVVTSADELNFADGKVFTAAPSGSDATLSTAAPSAFGFLSATPQSITINGSTLSVSNQQPLTIIGGNVTMTGGTLQSSAGRITIASVASSGTVNVDPAQANSTVSLSGFASRGTINLSNSATIVTDGNQGGRIVICGGQLMAVSSTVSARTTGSGNGAGIDVELTGQLSLTGSSIVTDTTGAGAGGPVTVSAAAVTIENAGEIAATTNGPGTGGNLDINVAGAVTLDGDDVNQFTGLSIDTGNTTPGNGNAGDLKLVAGTLTITDGAEIDATTSGAGAGGNSNITVSGSMSLSEGAFPNQLTGIRAQSVGNGNGGDVTVSAANLSITDVAEISTSTFGAGAGGNCNINVSGAMMLDGGLINQFTGVEAEPRSTAPGGGKGGNITVAAGSLTIINDAEINVSTLGTGAGGNCNVAVSGAMMLDGRLTNFDSGVFAESESPTTGGGSSGNIAVAAGTLAITNGAEIDATTFGSGAGGNCSVTVSGAMTLDAGSVADPLTGVSSQTESTTPCGGAGGNLTVFAGTLSMANGAQISATTSGTGAGGKCDVTVSGAMTLDGILDDPPLAIPSGILSNSNFTGPGGGAGGDVTVHAGTIVISRGAAINATTYGTGAGGSCNVTVTGALTVDGASIPDRFTEIGAATELSTPGGGTGGSITIYAGTLATINGGTIGVSTFGLASAGNILLNVSSAALIDGGPSGIKTGTGVYARSILEGVPNAGKGGDITLDALSLTLSNGAGITADSAGSGLAGGITIHCPGLVSISDDSTISVSGAQSDGGDVTVTSGQDVFITHDSNLSAQAGANGGNISISCPNLMDLDDSQLTAQANGSGGSISIDPELVVFRDSGVTASAVTGRGGAVDINATDGFFTQNTPVNVSSTFGVQGTFALSAPPLDLTASLAVLPGALTDINAQLAPTCSMFAGSSSSTLIESSNGGLSPQPGGWMPLPPPAGQKQSNP